MFKLKRVEKGETNRWKVSTRDGYIEIVGSDDFVIRMVRDLCQSSEEFQAIMRRNLKGETLESVAKEMRKAGFDERIVRDFENGDFWPDTIFEK